MSNSDFLSDVQAQPDLLETALRAHLAAGSQLEIAATTASSCALASINTAVGPVSVEQ